MEHSILYLLFLRWKSIASSFWAFYVRIYEPSASAWWSTNNLLLCLSQQHSSTNILEQSFHLSPCCLGNICLSGRQCVNLEMCDRHAGVQDTHNSMFRERMSQSHIEWGGSRKSSVNPSRKRVTRFRCPSCWSREEASTYMSCISLWPVCHFGLMADGSLWIPEENLKWWKERAGGKFLFCGYGFGSHFIV